MPEGLSHVLFIDFIVLLATWNQNRAELTEMQERELGDFASQAGAESTGRKIHDSAHGIRSVAITL